MGAERVMLLSQGPVLGIETSCDETSAAVVLGTKVLSNVVASQIAMHERWGGIVPEAAARAHVESMIAVIEEALYDANVRPEDLAGLGVTNRPGLLGALSVGLTAAKSLSLAWHLPFVGVHHLEGHLLSPWLNQSADFLPLPALVLIASGGHTELVQVDAVGHYQLRGETIDDAAGEAFDKGARLLGLGYPGGKALQELAVNGNPQRYSLPRGLAKDPLNYSFSGLKTAVLRTVEREGADLDRAGLAASLQAAIVESLTNKMRTCIDMFRPASVALVGGVAANRALRASLEALANSHGLPFAVPDFEFCTDNAAMIALAASVRLRSGDRAGWDLDAFPQADLP
jgi:N6-L-threonylcarbamoyladenine synthase